VRALQAAVLLAALGGTSCARHTQERQALIDFFEAARLRDTTVLSNMGTATFEPRTDGVVQQFDIERVDPQEPRTDARRTTGDAARTLTVLESKTVTLVAQVRTPAGDLVRERMVVTFDRLEGERWTITQLRASRISPAASSAPPN
jgi:hypothetical protein